MNRYNREELIDSIKQVSMKLNKEDITIIDYANHGKYHEDLVIQVFKSWTRALEAAGLTKQRSLSSTKRTADYIVSEIKRVSKLLGKDKISFRQLSENSDITAGDIKREFDKWSIAAEAAGVKTGKRIFDEGVEIKKEDIIKDIQKVSKLTDENPLRFKVYQERSSFTVSQLKNHFGTWNEAAKAAGLKTNDTPADRFIALEDIRENLQMMCDQKGGPISRKEFDLHPDRICTSVTVSDKFGTWDDALDAVGHPEPQITEDDIKDSLISVSELLGTDKVSIYDYAEYGEHSVSSLLKIHGTWLSALEHAGLESPRKFLTEEELVEDLIRVKEKIGDKHLSVGIYDKYGKNSPQTYIKRFETWNKALERAGIPTRSIKIK